jgi:hypothetical protein
MDFHATTIGRNLCKAASFVVALGCNGSGLRAESYPVGLDFQGSWKVDCNSKIENGFDLVFIQETVYVAASNARCELDFKSGFTLVVKNRSVCRNKGFPKRLIGSFDLKDGQILVSSYGKKIRYAQCEGHYAPR